MPAKETKKEKQGVLVNTKTLFYFHSSFIFQICLVNFATFVNSVHFPSPFPVIPPDGAHITWQSLSTKAIILITAVAAYQVNSLTLELVFIYFCRRVPLVFFFYFFNSFQDADGTLLLFLLLHCSFIKGSANKRIINFIANHLLS
jgi:hypothetical protein